MKNDSMEESIRIAEELANDLIYIYREREAKSEPSSKLEEWKEKHPSLYNELKSGKGLSGKMAFYHQVETEKPLREIRKRIHPHSNRLHIIRIAGIAASFILALALGTLAFMYEKAETEEQIPLWTQAVPGKEKSWCA